MQWKNLQGGWIYLTSNMKVKYLENLIAGLSHLPGIGKRTATRLAYYILEMKDEDAKFIADSILEAKANIKFCENCGNYMSGDRCEYCDLPKGSAEKIVVVESPKDVEIIKKAVDDNAYYHVLHGTISPIDGIKPDDLNIKNLIIRLREDPSIKEVILATNSTIEGEATAMYICDLLRDTKIAVYKIASGISVGTEIEYTDEITLKKAYEGRKKL